MVNQNMRLGDGEESMNANEVASVKAEMHELERLSLSLGGMAFQEFRDQMRVLARAAASRHVVRADSMASHVGCRQDASAQARRANLIQHAPAPMRPGENIP